MNDQLTDVDRFLLFFLCRPVLESLPATLRSSASAPVKKRQIAHASTLEALLFVQGRPTLLSGLESEIMPSPT